MAKIPCQQMVTTAEKKLLAMAFGCHLQVFESSTGKLLSSTSIASTNPAGSNHAGLIRLLVIHQQPSPDSDKPAILISTGEDKLLKTWELPSLRLIDSRELIKRATSIAVSPNGKNIVIADKFGDVYDLPFDAPSQIVFQSDPDQDQPTQASEKDTVAPDSSKAENQKPLSKSLAPIAGHVSVLTALTFIPSQPAPLLVTADRDEHIRLSRYPKAWSIVSYLLGHRKFVSALLWISAPGGELSSGRLLSGGGDNEIYVWDYSEGSCLKKIDVGGLRKGMKVRPQKQAWFSKTRTNKRRRRQQDSKSESADHQNEGGGDHNSERACDLEKEADQSKTFPERTCVNKIICTSSCDLAGSRHVLVTSVGSSILAAIPLSSIFTSQADCDDQVKYHDMGVPILDMVDLSNRHILVSLDTSFSPSTHVDFASSVKTPLFRVLTIGPDQSLQLEESSESTFPSLAQLNTSASIEPSTELAMPTSDVLYPELLLFTKDEPLATVHADPSQTLDSSRAGGRSGKKEEGRQLSQQRCEMVLERATLNHKS